LENGGYDARVRWLVLIIVAVASFAAYLLWIHGSADTLVAAEREVSVRLRALASETTREAREEKGYRFEWISGQELPAVLVASPAEHGETGVRWFATVDGREVYQYDPVLFRAPENRPDLGALRRYLALDPDQRRHRGLPGGWQTAE
jgi:hypothetical protein